MLRLSFASSKIPSYLFLFLFIFLSCQKEDKRPEVILPEEKFIDALTEFQIAESIVRLGYHRFPDSMHLNDSVYNAAFRKVNVSREDFDTTLNYYLNRPGELDEIYKQVITRLNTRSAELEEVEYQESPAR